MIWQPVYVDERPYYFPLGSFAAYIDYVVTDYRGVAIRQGRLDISYKTSPEPPVIIDDCDVLRRDESDPNNPAYDPDTTLSTIKFRVLPTRLGMMFQYGSLSSTTLTLRFKVSTLFHIPGDYVPLKNIGYILSGTKANPIPIYFQAQGIVMERPAAASLVINYGGYAEYNYDANDFGPGIDYVYAIQADNFGNVYVCGSIYETTPQALRSAALIKYSSTGEFLWQRGYTQDNTVYTSSFFGGMTIDGNGNVICVGATEKSDTGPIQNALFGERTGICVKFAPNGDQVFARSYVDQDFGRNDNVYLEGVTTTSDAIFIAGYMVEINGYAFKSFAARVDPATGTVIWSNHLQSNLPLYSNTVYLNNIKIDSAGNVLHMGKLEYGTFLFRKLNGNTGTTIFTKAYTTEYDYSYWDYDYYSLGPDDSIYHSEIDPYDENALIITKFDPNGDLVWQKKHGRTDYFYFQSQCYTFITETRIYIVSGVLILELDLDGNFESVRGVLFPGSGFEEPFSEAATMRNGHFYINLTDIISIPENRERGEAIAIVPVEWDGQDTNYQNMRIVRPMIDNTTEEFNAVNNDTTSTVVSIDPFPTLLLVENTTPQIEKGQDFTFYRRVFGLTDPETVIPDSVNLPININTFSGGNYWVNTTMMLEPNREYNDSIEFYPYAATTDSEGNIYSFGSIDAYGLYGNDRGYVQKTSPTGELVWMKNIINPQASLFSFGLIAVDETGIYIAQSTTRYGQLSGMVVYKLNLDATAFLWHKRITCEYIYGEDIQVIGDQLFLLAYNNSGRREGYLIKLNRLTGVDQAKRVLSTGPTDPQNFLEFTDNGDTYYLLSNVRTNFNWGFIITKHLKVDDSVVWTRRGYIEANQTTSSRIDIDMTMCLDPEGNIYVSGGFTDFNLNYVSDYKYGRLLAKYDSNGTLLAQKTYKVEKATGRRAAYGYGIGCFWQDDRIITNLTGGGGFAVDAFDANLNPIWGKMVYHGDGGYASNDLMVTQSGTDASSTVYSYFAGADLLSYVFRIPNDGVFAFNNEETSLLLYELTFIELTTYPFVGSSDIYIISIGNTSSYTPVPTIVVEDVLNSGENVTPLTTFINYKTDI